jgi:hypothetical protein
MMQHTNTQTRTKSSNDRNTSHQKDDVKCFGMFGCFFRPHIFLCICYEHTGELQSNINEKKEANAEIDCEIWTIIPSILGFSPPSLISNTSLS